MKKHLLVGLVVLFFFGFSANAAKADISIGYRTFCVIFPHTFALTYYDKSSGLGVEGSADFGTSFISNFSSSVFNSIFPKANTTTSFYTISLTKDFIQHVNDRYYLKGGVITSNSNVSNGSIGLGWQRRDVLNNKNFAIGAVISYPEIFLVTFDYFL